MCCCDFTSDEVKETLASGYGVRAMEEEGVCLWVSPYKMSLLGHLLNHFIDALNGDHNITHRSVAATGVGNPPSMAIKLFTLLAIGLALIALSQGE